MNWGQKVGSTLALRPVIGKEVLGPSATPEFKCCLVDRITLLKWRSRRLFCISNKSDMLRLKSVLKWPSLNFPYCSQYLVCAIVQWEFLQFFSPCHCPLLVPNTFNTEYRRSAGPASLKDWLAPKVIDDPTKGTACQSLRSSGSHYLPCFLLVWFVRIVSWSVQEHGPKEGIHNGHYSAVWTPQVKSLKSPII